MRSSYKQVRGAATLLMILAVLVGGLAPGQIALSQAPRETAATCTVPFTQSIRGRPVEFDLCYVNEFNHDGVDYVIRVYHTETFNQDPMDFNYSQCDPMVEDPDVACEHALPDIDNGNGDNARAVQLANEAEGALRFYHDMNLLPMPGTDFNIYVAEDPQNGWIVEPDGIITDDETGETVDALAVRWNVYHEMQHLIQKQFVNGNWNLWWTEGLARTIEDRVDPALDAAIKAFIVDSRRMLKNHPDYDYPRSSDILNAKYRAVVWWTWVLDQYAEAGEVPPALGWEALKDFYAEISNGNDSLTAADDFLQAKGSSFTADFIDYTLAMYAYKYNPADPRLGFLDTELINETNLENHTIISGAPPAWQGDVPWVAPRSSRYYEFEDAGMCDYIGFVFDGQGKPYAFSVLTVKNGTLEERWTSTSIAGVWAGRSADLDRVAGVVTGLDFTGSVQVLYGCAEPSLTIVDPTTTAFKMVGTANNPRQFLVQLEVTALGGTPVAGLSPDAFSVEIEVDGGGTPIPADVINALYVQDAYWLLVQAPDDVAGAQTGFFYDLIVHLDDYATDTENNALLYVEQTQDKVLVLDRSGSMGDNGKLEAAQNAAALMVNELSDDDQGGYVAFDQDAYLRESLNGMNVATHRQDMETSIAAETPGGNTSIGDGMQRAAQEHDANGIADNACTFVLLSDGHENADAYWADVQAGVVDNGCALDVVGLGPQANEDLLQQIAGAGAGGGARAASGAADGSYAYAPDTGLVSFSAPAGLVSMGWDNNLSRIYDYKTTRAAGRQRITSDARLSTGVEIYPFEVDLTTDELVVATAWQTPTVNFDIRLIDPDGLQLSNTFSRLSTLGTNLVWRVPAPKPGSWMLSVRNLPQEVYVSASALTDLQLHLFTGANVPDAYPGMLVPILVSFVNLGQPALGASVQALVTAPNGNQKMMMLHDDGAHGDTLPGDGVYGNFYTVTSLGEFVPADPTSYGDGAEPSSVGSYQVDAVGIWNGHRREAQGSFVLQQADDRDGDRLPTPYEEEHGLDPDDPNDATMDQDHDRLTTACEFNIGTHPLNPDTDQGGEIDGSEVPNCVPDVQDPNDPADDRVGHFQGLIATPEATVADAFVTLSLVGLTGGGTFEGMDLYRRTYDGAGMMLQDWEMIAAGWTQPTYMDRAIITGRIYNYRAIPSLMEPVRSVAYDSRTVESAMVLALDDPYPPAGSIVIDHGAETTADSLVSLSIAADDLTPEHGDLGTDPIPGSPFDELMMRLSNSDDFSGIAWQPYQPTVENWDLGAVPPGAEAAVYLQLMDAAGNVGASGLGMFDTIRMAGTRIYLPLVYRNH